MSKLIFNNFVFILLLTACTERDLDLEKSLTEKLKKFRNSNVPTMSLNDVLGKSWKKVCVQSPYALLEDFNEYTGEKVNYIQDISENEMVFWIFYKNGSIRTAKISRKIMVFRSPRNKKVFKDPRKVGAYPYCTPANNPFIYTYEYDGVREFFYFRN